MQEPISARYISKAFTGRVLEIVEILNPDYGNCFDVAMRVLEGLTPQENAYAVELLAANPNGLSNTQGNTVHYGLYHPDEGFLDTEFTELTSGKKVKAFNSVEDAKDHFNAAKFTKVPGATVRASDRGRNRYLASVKSRFLGGA